MIEKENLSFIGKKTGYLTVLDVYKGEFNSKKVTMVLCKCACGNEKKIPLSLFKSGKWKSCGKCVNGVPCSSYVGKKFGHLTVLEVYKDEKHGTIAICKCKCGNRKEIYLNQLTRKLTSACGKCDNGVPYSSYIGKKFGHLTVIDIQIVSYKNKHTPFALCKCDCGNEKKIMFSELKFGRRGLCGECLNGVPYSSIIGKRYGYFTVLDIYTDKYGGINRTIALCKCDCGKKKKVLYSSLLRGKPVSCGCLSNNRIRVLRKIKFGNLSVLKNSKHIEDGLRYVCKCSCGNEVEVLESDLFTGKVTCCEECKK